MYEIFEQLLKERGMSLAEFSRQTGISKSTLSDWKNGKFKLKDDKRRKIADFFGVSLDYLDGLTDEREKKEGFFLGRPLYTLASTMAEREGFETALSLYSFIPLYTPMSAFSRG